MIVKTKGGQQSSLEFQKRPSREARKCCQTHLNGKFVRPVYIWAWLYYKGDRKAYSGRQRSCDYSQEEYNVPTRNGKAKLGRRLSVKSD